MNTNFARAILCGLALYGLSSGNAVAQEGTGLKYSVAGDIVGTLGAKKATTASSDRDRMIGREAELSLYGPVDHLFDAQSSLAAHFEDGESTYEIHELFVSSSKLIPRSRLKLGKFFLGVGKLNRVHRHDWPFTTAPLVQSELFNTKEGADDAGFEYGYLLPVPFYLDLTVGLTSGFTFGHSHSAGSRPLTPTHYARLATYFDLFSDGGAELGLNYLGRTAGDRTKSDYVGLDVTAKWRDGKTVRFLLQSEVWWRQTKAGNGVIERKLGSYTFPQFGFSPNWLIGLRFDTLSFLNKTNSLTQQREKNINYWIVPTLTYKASEFSTFRLSYTWKNYRELSQVLSSDRLIELQAIFILGAHPAHDF